MTSIRGILLAIAVASTVGCPGSDPEATPAKAGSVSGTAPTSDPAPAERAQVSDPTQGSAASAAAEPAVKAPEAPAPASEVAYEGRPLSAWTQDLLGPEGLSLQERMQDKDGMRAGMRALEAFAALGPKAAPAVPELVAAVVGSDAARARSASAGLARVGAAAATPALCDALDSASSEVQLAIADALCVVFESDPAPGEVKRAALKLLATPSDAARNKVIFVLTTPPADEELCRALIAAHRERPLPTGISDPLCKMGASAVPALVEWLNSDGREQAGGLNDLVCQRLPSSAIPALLDAAQGDVSPTTRERLWLALASVAGKGGPENRQLVEVALALGRGGGELTQRVRALEAVGKALGAPGVSEVALPALTELLGDERFEVAGAAARALKGLGPRAAAACPELIALLKRLGESKTAYVGAQEGVITTLGAIGPQAADAVPLLRELSEHPILARQAKEALQKIAR
ncbi:MAG: hypothetical protein KDD82_20555 [Planctomycetes bacterium]|nr:hypothetical protein [Planctomycetota bacterium]